MNAMTNVFRVIFCKQPAYRTVVSLCHTTQHSGYQASVLTLDDSTN